MKTLIRITMVFVVFVLFMIGLSVFGPQDTYRWEGGGDGWGPYTYVQDLPVWFGEILRYTSGAITENEAKKQDQDWLKKHPEYKDLYEINEHGWLSPKSFKEDDATRLNNRLYP